MAQSALYRFLLVALLPAIAVLIYLEGQQYDPALISFNSTQSSEETITDFFPREIEGLFPSGPVRTYTKENLYEYVNGHAEYFISAGFKKLVVGEYTTNTGSEPDVLIDIYDMGRSIQAFGIVSDESRGELREIVPGLKGFKTPLSISFAKGQYYVKIAAFRESLSLENVAKTMDASIAAGDDPFPEFSSFPDIGEIISTRFIKEAYRGLDFLNNVMEREYKVNDGKVQVFLVMNDKDNITETAASLIHYFKESDIAYSEEKKGDTIIYLIDDPYEGKWLLLSARESIIGAFGSLNDTIINALQMDGEH
jgi:hypothetical protein